MSERQQTQQTKKQDSTFQKQSTLTIQSPVSHPASIIQRARINPKSLTAADFLQLQRTIGNRAVVRLLSEIGAIPSKAKQAPPVQRQELVQRQEIPEEEEPLQGKIIGTVQRKEIPEEEEPLQGKFENKPEKITCSSCVADPIMQMQEIPEEEEPLQGKFETIQRLEPEEEEKLQMKSVVQRQEIPEEEEPIQGKMIGTIQLQEIPEEEEPLQKKSENNTGMPANLKAGVESLSGIDMSDVRVHYNSSKPAEVGALAYTQGTNVHVAPGQERHLPHEAWHVVQQAQGRVRPTMQMKGLGINDDPSLEHEADIMGAKTTQFVPAPDEEMLQGKLGEGVAQKAEKVSNNTGLPDYFMTGIENLSGVNMEQAGKKESNVNVTQCYTKATLLEKQRAYLRQKEYFQDAFNWATTQKDPNSRKFYLGPREKTFDIHDKPRTQEPGPVDEFGIIKNRTLRMQRGWSEERNDAIIEGLSSADTRFRIASSNGQSIYDFLTRDYYFPTGPDGALTKHRIHNSNDLFYMLDRVKPEWSRNVHGPDFSVTMRELGILLDEGYTPQISRRKTPQKKATKGMKLTFVPPPR
jgi:hypothetical protein